MKYVFVENYFYKNVFFFFFFGKLKISFSEVEI